MGDYSPSSACQGLGKRPRETGASLEEGKSEDTLFVGPVTKTQGLREQLMAMKHT